MRNGVWEDDLPLVVRTQVRVGNSPTARRCLNGLDDLHGGSVTIIEFLPLRPCWRLLPEWGLHVVYMEAEV